jgi:hypothetical protein
MKLNIDCRKAAALILRRQDEPLGAGERVALRLHMVICQACNRFEAQMGVMRRSVDRWKHYRNDAHWGDD